MSFVTAAIGCYKGFESIEDPGDSLLFGSNLSLWIFVGLGIILSVVFPIQITLFLKHDPYLSSYLVVVSDSSQCFRIC